MPASSAPRSAGGRGQIPGATGEVEFVKVSDADVQVHKPMSARTKARKRALDVLFEAEAKGVDPLLVLDEHVRLAEPGVRPYTIDLVRGVVAFSDAIEQRIADATTAAWPLNRMAGVDRNLARIATYEIDYADVAPEAAMSEAVLLADELSTDDSATFLNGLLATIAKTKVA